MTVRIPEAEWPKSVATPLEIWDALPLCGCGCPEAALETLHWLLASFAHDRTRGIPFDVTWPPQKQLHQYLESRHAGLYWIAIYALSSDDLTEHGSGAAASWLTPAGERALNFLDIFGDDDGSDPDEPLWPHGCTIAKDGNYYELTEAQAEALKRYR